jgi:hypothetical protein
MSADQQHSKEFVGAAEAASFSTVAIEELAAEAAPTKKYLRGCRRRQSCFSPT